ncbi:MAG: cation:proton antiporter [Actinomycetales bacterium]|nr:cation:proton antiporter [Actinomycetales bacterium]
MAIQVLSAATSATTSFALVELGLVFVGLGVLSWIALKLRISAVPLFLLAGLSLGKGGIAPLALSEDFLNLGAEIGALLLLLVMGFEYSAQELVTTLRSKWTIGLVDLATNAIPAAAIAFLLGYGWVGAIAFAGIMFVSSSGIASQLIRESGWSRSNIAKRASSILVFEDIVLAPYLPVLAAVTLGLSALGGLISVGLALVVTLGVFLIAMGREIPGLKTLAKSGPGPLLLLTFGVALAISGAANIAGFSGVIAAFLFGLLLTGEVAESLRSRFAPLRDVFSAVFFLFFGLSISAADVFQVLPAAVLFTIFGIVGKFFVGWLLGRDFQDPLAWRRIGAFLASRGEFSMIIAATVASALSVNVREITLGIVVLTSLFSTLAIRALRSRLEV